ncbi:rhomboid family intramembrane serine protease GlpG [Psychromonas aquatilis]|uniref:Rhomboid family intramembrane serine protease GlpG n=1 Tax=Psychromonas aquatilis TaxID=2005072 RepID=A0ABU9GM27_9GAMM
MWKLHSFEQLRLAQALSDYLNTQKIKNSVQDDGVYHQIMLENEKHMEQAQCELAKFLDNPNQSKYLSASWESGQINKSTEPLSTYNANLLTTFKRHGGVITHSVFILCLAIYAFTALGLFNPIHSVFAFFVTQPFDLMQSWRFITPAFLHFSLLHIVFNLLWWWQLAGLVEKRQGRQRLLILFIFSAMASNLAQFFLVGPYFGGLSGVVYALAGYCWLFGKLDKTSPVNLNNTIFIFLLGWLVLGFVNLLPANVANYAHLVGLLAGLLLAATCYKLKLK